MAKKPTQKQKRKTIKKIKHPLVGIVMGSQSDWETMRHAAETLKKLGIPNEVCLLYTSPSPRD